MSNAHTAFSRDACDACIDLKRAAAWSAPPAVTPAFGATSRSLACSEGAGGQPIIQLYVMCARSRWNDDMETSLGP